MQGDNHDLLNVAGRGEPLTFARCIEIAQAKLLRVPGKWAMQQILAFLWKRQISAIPPEAVPYMTGEYIMNTDRLRRFLGPEYEDVIHYTVTDAFADSFKAEATAQNPVDERSWRLVCLTTIDLWLPQTSLRRQMADI